MIVSQAQIQVRAYLKQIFVNIQPFLKQIEQKQVIVQGKGCGELCLDKVSDFPETFDLRDKWASCFKAVPDLSKYIGEQVLPAQILSERFCISSSYNYMFTLSPQEIVDCATQGGWRYIYENGIFTSS